MTNPLFPARILAIVGPTAAGKSSLAEALADRLDADLLSIDSMQVYKGLDVGTAKPSVETRARFKGYHGLDIVEPQDTFDVAAFMAHADEVIATAHAKGRGVITCGGTGLYLRALRHGLVPTPGRDEGIRARLRARRDEEGSEALFALLGEVDPKAALRISPTDWVRVERALEVYEMTGEALSDWQERHRFQEERYEMQLIGCTRPRHELHARINARLEVMWGEGLLEEAQTLIDADLPAEAPPRRALGYRQAIAFLRGELPEAEALRVAQRDTRRFARRQFTWFRKDPEIHWLNAPVAPGTISTLAGLVQGWWDGGVWGAEGLPESVVI